MNMFLRCLVVGLLLLSGNALAVNYTLPSATFALCQGGAGNWNQATNTCSGQISFASGDTLTSSSALHQRRARAAGLLGKSTAVKTTKKAGLTTGLYL